jgi:hypothetical protein
MGEFRKLYELTEKIGLDEALKVIKKNWKFTDNSNQKYTIEINDSNSHSILGRIQTRTNNQLGLNEFNKKLQKGVDLILLKAKNGFFKKDISFIELTYSQSLFKVIFMIKPTEKYLRINSIFEMSFTTSNALYWNINEFFEEFPELKTQRIDESHFYTMNNNMFCVEVNEEINSYDVYLADNNDIFKLDITE